MSGAGWAAAASLLLHLSGVGALPKEIPATEVSAYATDQPVRVLIFRGATSLTLRPGAASAIQAADSEEPLGELAAGDSVTITRAGGEVAIEGGGARVTGPDLLVRPTEEGEPAVLSGRGGWGTRGAYPGVLEFRAAGGLSAIEHVDLESYTAGVVAAEVPKSFPLEAMKAQAVAARTYTLFHLGDHEAEGADLCGQVHCHAYAGVPAAEAKATRAAAETAGQVLTYHGLLIDAQYHAACGGQTVAAWETRQGKLLPYLAGADDRDAEGEAFCATSHDVTWTKRFTLAEAQQLVAKNLRTVLGDPNLTVGKLRSLRVAERSGDRVQWLEVVTTAGTYRLMGDSIRWLFGAGVAGPSGLRSTQFDLVTKQDAKGTPSAFVFTGRGHGHGIGMCQWGARSRAAAGETAEDILAAYYPGTEVTDLRTEAPMAREPGA